MTRLRTIGNRLQPAPRRQMASTNVSERRITGRTLQNRRLRLWSRDPHCAHCGRLVDYPHGFELDHKVPLHQGGPDTDDNCQVLCVYMTTDMSKAGCHVEKTKDDVNGH
jgi:hypothetical protein